LQLRKQAVRVVAWFGFIRVKIPRLATHLWELLFGSELRCSRRARTVLLSLEVLEARVQLSTYNWVGGDSLHFASNLQNWWQPDANGQWHPATQAIGPGDDLKFTGVGPPDGVATSGCVFDPNFVASVNSITLDTGFNFGVTLGAAGATTFTVANLKVVGGTITL
jgi:hypothetical protein